MKAKYIKPPNKGHVEFKADERLIGWVDANNRVSFYHFDIRWVNVWDRELGSVNVLGKIIGDE